MSATGWDLVLTLPAATGPAWLGLSEVAMALHLSGAGVDRDLPPVRALALVRGVCQELGVGRIRELAGDARQGNVVWLEGGPAPGVWTIRRQQVCTDVAARLGWAVTCGELAGAPGLEPAGAVS